VALAHLGAIRLDSQANFCFFCQVSNTRFYRFPVGQISRNLDTRSIGEVMNPFGRKKSLKIRYLRTNAQIWQAVFLQLTHISTIGKKC